MLQLLSHPLLGQLDGLLLRAGITEPDCMTLAHTRLASPAHDLPPGPLQGEVGPFAPLGHWTLAGGSCWLLPHLPRFQGCQGNTCMVADGPYHLHRLLRWLWELLLRPLLLLLILLLLLWLLQMRWLQLEWSLVLLRLLHREGPSCLGWA